MEHRQINDTLHTQYILLCVEESARQHYSFVLTLHDADHRILDFRLVWDITECRDIAESIFSKLVAGDVTPCTAIDIISDFL